MDVIVGYDEDYTMIYVEKGHIILVETYPSLVIRDGVNRKFSLSFLADDICILKARRIHYSRLNEKSSVVEAYLGYDIYVENGEF